MAKHKKVIFLQEFNGPRIVVGPIRIDTLSVGVGVFIFVYTSSTIASFKISLTLLLSFFLTYVALKAYIKAKEKASKGFLWHSIYMSGIWNIKLDEKKFEELNRMESKDYILDSTDRLFTE